MSGVDVLAVPWHYNVTFAKRQKNGRWVEPTVAIKAASPGDAITAICTKHGIKRRSISRVIAIAPAAVHGGGA